TLRRPVGPARATDEADDFAVRRKKPPRGATRSRSTPRTAKDRARKPPRRPAPTGRNPRLPALTAAKSRRKKGHGPGASMLLIFSYPLMLQGQASGRSAGWPPPTRLTGGQMRFVVGGRRTSTTDDGGTGRGRDTSAVHVRVTYSEEGGGDVCRHILKRAAETFAGVTEELCEPAREP
ncbi:hypothetical protein THAOC_22798, partial [Thalassiosira oceanica]